MSKILNFRPPTFMGWNLKNGTAGRIQKRCFFRLVSGRFLEDERLEPTAITHEKKGKSSEPNPYDYPPGNDHISPKNGHFESMIFRTSQGGSHVNSLEGMFQPFIFQGFFNSQDPGSGTPKVAVEDSSRYSCHAWIQYQVPGVLKKGWSGGFRFLDMETFFWRSCLMFMFLLWVKLIKFKVHLV